MIKCPACNTELKPPRCSKSRYDDVLWICSDCGVKEAFEGFFWRIKHHTEKPSQPSDFNGWEVK